MWPVLYLLQLIPWCRYCLKSWNGEIWTHDSCRDLHFYCELSMCYAWSRNAETPQTLTILLSLLFTVTKCYKMFPKTHSDLKLDTIWMGNEHIGHSMCTDQRKINVITLMSFLDCFSTVWGYPKLSICEIYEMKILRWHSKQWRPLKIRHFE